MIPKECKRLAEVDFPIAKVGAAVRSREKKFPVPRGLPSTMHQWWARRPLGSCRAMLLALLWPDPCDPLCPQNFKDEARRQLRRVAGCNPGTTDEELRRALLHFIADFANWDLAANQTYLEVSWALVRAAYTPDDGSPYEPPLVVDPFAGGGSIPLEALRVGCEAFASDLNPVACLILKVMLEEIPRYGLELAEELRRVGAQIKRQAEQELAELYPNDPDGAKPIAYLWARTVRCEAPHCGAEIPLVRSSWLAKKSDRKIALQYKVVCPEGEPPQVEFGIFQPKSDKEVPGGTVARARATCLCCGAVLSPERVRAQLAAQRGGADVLFDAQGRRIGGARMLAVVTLKRGLQGRYYRLPTERDYQAVWKAQQRLKAILDEWERGGRQGLCPVPDEPTPTKDTHRAVGSQIPLYGIRTFGDLFTARQKVALLLVAQKISDFYGKGDAKSIATAELLAMAMDKVADFNCSLSGWRPSNEDVGHLFGRQALPIVWDFVETNLCGSYYVDFGRAVEHLVEVVNHTASTVTHSGQVQICDAAEHPLPDETAHAWFTDPPYYDAIPYADLSDFFLVWLKRVLPNHPLLRDPFDPQNPLAPKSREIIQCEKVEGIGGQLKDRGFYEERMAMVFAEGRRVLKEDGVGSVVFAHKTTEGWEALLSSMIRGGWTITGSWPIATESSTRLNARETASLATSIHLICRPRPVDAPVGDWGEVLRELPRRVGEWMERLQAEGIRGADLVFACIGPALEIFSRYSRVETPEGREVTLAEFLEKVWEVVGRTALAQVLGTTDARNGLAGALEEDARLTALFLWTLQATNGRNGPAAPGEGTNEEVTDDEDEEPTPRGQPKGYRLVFDVVRRFAQPLGIDLSKWEGRIIKTEKGVVRLLTVAERAKQLLGPEAPDTLGDPIAEKLPKNPQLKLFPEPAGQARGVGEGPRRAEGGLGGESGKALTTLDQVHVAMLLQAMGQSETLRTWVKAQLERGPAFLRLANTLSALYPKGSEEKRLLDAMLLAVPK